jgi:hypothetical protein
VLLIEKVSVAVWSQRTSPKSSSVADRSSPIVRALPSTSITRVFQSVAIVSVVAPPSSAAIGAKVRSKLTVSPGPSTQVGRGLERVAKADVGQRQVVDGQRQLADVLQLDRHHVGLAEVDVAEVDRGGRGLQLAADAGARQADVEAGVVAGVAVDREGLGQRAAHRRRADHAPATRGPGGDRAGAHVAGGDRERPGRSR